jgi:hypothetical protein
MVAITAKLNEYTYCQNCHESKLCARLHVNQCVAIIFLCADCIDKLKQPLKNPNADKPLTPEELIKLQKAEAKDKPINN